MDGRQHEGIFRSAIIGGTAGEIGGGKFANGAVTGAFVQAFGSIRDKRVRYGLSDGDSAGPFTDDAPAGLAALREANPELVANENRLWEDSKGWFGTEIGAKEHALVAYESLTDGSLKYEFYAAGSNSDFVGLPSSLPKPKGYRVALVEHTHPRAWSFGNRAYRNYVQGPSTNDMQVAGDYPGAFHVIQGKTPLGVREFIYYGKSAGFR
ncbi:MAG: hypothetical protein KDI87_06195 [Gammaproteobacteria bacterium]|nr:hypothetical protein [Gammaproteobacteria bacterium]MCP5139926.1 hypothetical protein [Chromatiales bacterium]